MLDLLSEAAGRVVLAVGVLLGSAEAVYQPGTNQQPNTQQQEANESETVKTPKPLVVAVVHIVKETTGDAASKQTENEKTDREKADLVAQQAMAWWAETMAWIVGFQAFINILTLIYLRKTFQDTKRTAEAAIRSADVSERALTQLERSHVVFKLTYDTTVIDNLARLYSGQEFSGKFSYTVVNCGRSAAILVEQKGKYFVCPKGELPTPIDAVKERGSNIDRGVVLPKNGETTFETTDNCSRETNGDPMFIVMGYLRYQDILTKTHILGFCAEYDPKLVRFKLVGDERYNYHRTESSPNSQTPQPRTWLSRVCSFLSRESQSA